MNKTLLKTIVSAAFFWSASAMSQVQLDLSKPQNTQLDAVISLPVESLKAVEANGEIMFMSENGRFVLRGQMYDIWNKKTLNSSAQIVDAVTRIHFDQMNTNFDNYNTFSIGSGEKQVVVFVDPTCSICHKMMKDAKWMGREYTFKFVVVPALGDKSDVLARKVFCAKDRQGALDDYMNHTLENVPQKEDCDTQGYDSTLMMAHLIDVKGVPFVVAPDGRYSTGKPANFKKWLEGK
ncbi:DsbC family protein [Marinomonas algarum]|uniref:Thiol:disulfide interchange protein n=1 Tax=Marinomonas algarum TaxID=2883105 RepID=A0A9X1IPH4_9GAMM|nr:DsbC family protein [Marinomonas algarum]MCB5162649.1 DsbC family protein [Marinomonas algarum]